MSMATSSSSETWRLAASVMARGTTSCSSCQCWRPLAGRMTEGIDHYGSDEWLGAISRIYVR